MLVLPSFSYKESYFTLDSGRAASLISKNFPTFKDITLEALETIFATKAIAKQLALAIALEGGMVSG